MTRDRLHFTRGLLPWIIAACALVIYLVTVNQWMSLASLPVVTKVSGLDWRLNLSDPLYYLLTLPARLLPPGAQPIALNIFSAVCAALTLALLARSVALLPHDRTREQRQREPGENWLLSIRGAWIPPLFAVLMLAFQISFWEHATAATGEMLDLLLFAYVIRCLLEFRISDNEKWLWKLAFVYGLGITNNWAMIGFFPLMLIALIWIKRLSFFQWRFVSRMLLFGIAGLLLYLLLPLIELFSSSDVTFWQALKANLGAQKNFLFNLPLLRSSGLRPQLLMLCLGSLLPLLLLGIRWPTFRGDTSAAGAQTTEFMFRVLHIAFLAVCLWVFFDWKFSGRVLGFGLPFLTFYFLTALCVGYFSGYVLLVFGVEAERNRRRSKSFSRILNKAIAALVWAALIIIPIALLAKNLPLIRAANGKLFERFTSQYLEKLPANDAVILSDDPIVLLLVEAAYQKQGQGKHLFLETASLPYGGYHLKLHERYPAWRDSLLQTNNLPASINEPSLLQWIANLSQTHPIYYLHPSFGYYFEHFYTRPRGLAFELKPYPEKSIEPPPLTPEEIAANKDFWQRAEANGLNNLAKLKKNNDAAWLAAFYSRSLDAWGVELEKAKDLKAAEHAFSEALVLNPNNIAASINKEFNAHLQQGEVRGFESTEEIDKQLKEYRTWENALSINGPFDEIEVRFQLGLTLTQGGNIRQGALQFLRILELKPDHIPAQIALAKTYALVGFPDKAMHLISAARKNPALNEDQDLALIQIEAEALVADKRSEAAEKTLLDAQKRKPKEPRLIDLLVQFYFQQQRYEDALIWVEKELRQNPQNTEALLTKGALQIQLKNFDGAIATMDRILQTDPNNIAALLNRAVANLQNKKYDAARNDYEALERLLPEKLFSIYYGLGEIAYQTGDKPEAIKNYRTYLELARPGTDEYNMISERLKELEGSKNP